MDIAGAMKKKTLDTLRVTLTEMMKDTHARPKNCAYPIRSLI